MSIRFWFRIDKRLLWINCPSTWNNAQQIQTRCYSNRVSADIDRWVSLVDRPVSFQFRASPTDDRSVESLSANLEHFPHIKSDAVQEEICRIQIAFSSITNRWELSTTIHRRCQRTWIGNRYSSQFERTQLDVCSSWRWSARFHSQANSSIELRLSVQIARFYFILTEKKKKKMFYFSCLFIWIGGCRSSEELIVDIDDVNRILIECCRLIRF